MFAFCHCVWSVRDHALSTQSIVYPYQNPDLPTPPLITPQLHLQIPTRAANGDMSWLRRHARTVASAYTDSLLDLDVHDNCDAQTRNLNPLHAAAKHGQLEAGASISASLSTHADSLKHTHTHADSLKHSVSHAHATMSHKSIAVVLYLLSIGARVDKLIGGWCSSFPALHLVSTCLPNHIASYV